MKMKWNLLWIFATVLLMVFVFSPPASATATQCGVHNKGSEWRCAKDNFQADAVRIGNESNRRATFKVSTWTSTCGKKGALVSDESFSLEPKSSFNYSLIGANANQCVEMFVYDCSPDKCTNILSAHQA